MGWGPAFQDKRWCDRMRIDTEQREKQVENRKDRAIEERDGYSIHLLCVS